MQSDQLFEECSPTFKYYPGLGKKKSNQGPIGPWYTPSTRIAPPKKEAITSKIIVALPPRTAKKKSSALPRYEEMTERKSMLVTRRMKTHVVQFLDHSKVEKAKTVQNRSKQCTMRQFSLQNSFPQNKAETLKLSLPEEPRFISLFKYKQNKINLKKANYANNNVVIRHERYKTEVPELNIRDHFEYHHRKAKVISVGFQKFLTFRRQATTSANFYSKRSSQI